MYISTLKTVLFSFTFHIFIFIHTMAAVDMLLLVCVALSVLTVSQANDVTQFGARGDGRTDDTQAFLKAWRATCNSGGTLVVPRGKTFLVNAMTFDAPCKPISVQIDGTIVAPSSRGEWRSCHSNSWLVFENVNGLHVGGSGVIDARGAEWWGNNVLDNVTNILDGANEGCNKPTTLRMIKCNSASLADLHFKDSGGNHVSLDDCNGVDIHNIRIDAPQNSPNTDGIDLTGSNHITISDSNIATGDDCIAIKNRCSQIHINRITCGPGHGISVGSLGRHGENAAVDGVFVRDCTFIRTEFSARIKTWQGGNGYVKNVNYDQITLNSVDNAIEIYQGYHDLDTKPNGGLQVSDVRFTNMHGSGDRIVLDCNPWCRNILVEQVNIRPSTKRQVEVTCRNVGLAARSVTPPIRC